MTVKELTDIINNLKTKSSSGVDELSNKVIKHIQKLIIQMLNTGLFPDSLKKSQKLYHYLKKIMKNYFQIIDLYPYSLQYRFFLKRLF